MRRLLFRCSIRSQLPNIRRNFATMASDGVKSEKEIAKEKAKAEKLAKFQAKQAANKQQPKAQADGAAAPSAKEKKKKEKAEEVVEEYVEETPKGEKKSMFRMSTCHSLTNDLLLILCDIDSPQAS